MLDPIYRLLRKTLPDGHLAYRYLVSLVPPESSTAVVVLSRISFDSNDCRDDAARLGLHRLCQIVGGYVDDYNRDLVQTWRSRYSELGVYFEEMKANINDLVLRNQQLGQDLSQMEEQLRAARAGNDEGKQPITDPQGYCRLSGVHCPVLGLRNYSHFLKTNEMAAYPTAKRPARIKETYTTGTKTIVHVRKV
ncbi:hypothetical protein PIB30_000028 [Stylosanthes scabra]|uniref:Uncharacterized protein n=1 Tax=Stylosanthes scabra TaxID=79078 RepID=A0ABU6Q1X0_9FABA|nr:hypothetical protein [Stylosanthes scabra]